MQPSIRQYSNPYESPQTSGEPGPGTSSLRLIFFLVNFGMSLLFGLLFVVAFAEALAGSGSPFGLLGGLCCTGPSFALAVAEWAFFVRKREWLRRPLGYVCGAAGFFAVFAFVSNVAEAVVDGHQAPLEFWIIFGSVVVTVAAYCAFCCWHRLKG